MVIGDSYWIVGGDVMGLLIHHLGNDVDVM
jgi:hypothetical protein